ncbi:MAG TPA: dihydroorotate dehydrogenase electron transfer subunit, partial [Oscillospiraceae bacterium]|nr:dihydroorotate dehydrogenase electron transfer subunit [Oscillospiraceae bacterium]
EALCSGVAVATADGSIGIRGTALHAIAAHAGSYDYAFACGPEPMLRAVAGGLSCGTQLSLEARMACGFGVCMGCSIRTIHGPRRVCKDGPVFRKEELLW